MSRANECLTHFDFYIFSNILNEWECNLFLHSCFSIGEKFFPSYNNTILSSLHILSFNVRGLNLRWQEVLLLTKSFKFDILILLETDTLDISFYEEIFSNFRISYQNGEHRDGGVLVLIRHGIHVSRVGCKLPNICVVNVKAEEEFRILGVYAPDSKFWS